MEKKDRELASIFAGKGVSWNELTENKKSLARRVYDAALPRLNKLKELSEQIEQYKFNKLTLAEELKINRKTLGSNNPEIAVLIETLVRKGQTYHPTAKSSSALKAEIEALKKRIELLHARDWELVKKDNDCRELQKNINLQQTQYNELKKKYDELEMKYQDLQLQLEDLLKPIKGNRRNNS